MNETHLHLQSFKDPHNLLEILKVSCSLKVRTSLSDIKDHQKYAEKDKISPIKSYTILLELTVDNTIITNLHD